jgi:multiple sugar transport system permease protein
MTGVARTRTLPPSPGSYLGRRMRGWMATSAITLLGLIVLSAFMLPLAFMASTALKDGSQVSDASAPLWPARPETFTWQGTDYPVYDVPFEDGSTRQLALVEPHREDAVFIDPANPDAGPITWVGRWRTLQQAWQLSLRWDNFAEVWDTINFGKLLFNTFGIAIISTVGTLISSICVAYGFSRFRIPGKNALFVILLSTIILPFQVTLIPSFAVYAWLGWTGTWLPLLVPHFFANAYNVFLLRQYFGTIPRDLDEAAMIDGASPLRVLTSVIVPQAIPAITAVGLFHFFWAWNDFFLPLIYLQGNADAQPLSVGIATFNALYSQKPTYLEASAILAAIVPVVIFFLSQRAFMRGIVVTGVEK